MLNGLLGVQKLKEAVSHSGRTIRGLDWRTPHQWPTSINIAKLPHDFRVLLGDNFSIDEGVFPLLHIPIEDVFVPEIDTSDDRDYEADDTESGAASAYMRDLIVSMKDGWPLPPIVVGNDAGGQGKKYGYPYDGKHRLNAAVRLGLKVVPAIDLTGIAT